LSEEKTAIRAPSLTSISATYDKNEWYLTLAHEQHKDYQGAGLTDRATKIGVAYRFGSSRIAGVAEKVRYETTTGPLERNAYYLSATHQIGRHGMRFGVARAMPKRLGLIDGNARTAEQRARYWSDALYPWLRLRFLKAHQLVYLHNAYRQQA